LGQHFSSNLIFGYRYEQDYEEAKRKTKEVLHPLKVELADLDDQVCQLSRLMIQEFEFFL
jgi:heterodisulfide reductase subunit B